MPSRGPRAFGALSLALATFAFATPALADDPISFTWQTPAGCPAAEAVVRESIRLLGGKTKEGRNVAGEAVVEKTADGFRVRLTTRIDGEQGSRELDGATCTSIANAVALILALSYDPNGVVADPAGPSEIGPSDTPGTGTTAPVEPKKQPPASNRTEPPKDREPKDSSKTSDSDSDGEGSWLGGAVAALVSADIGALPVPTVGFGGAAGLQLAWMRIELAGRYWLPQSETLEGGAGGNFEFATGELRGCPGYTWKPVTVGGCAGVELGRMAAEGFGVDRAEEASALWAAARLGGLVSVQVVGPLALRLDLGVSIPFDRPRWVLDRVGLVDQPAPVTARGETGAELRF
ncbi:MAG: hypothetical protein HOV80_28705 [Polyangiaceae bacterium]|nr:hypothetical protein [Polyangiaceae bacterium]